MSDPKNTAKVELADHEWRRRLDAEQYRVLRQAGTERAFTGRFWNHHQDGSYRCAGCDAVLFDASGKFDSGCGWPSFWAAADPGAIVEREDRSHGMVRTEVVCARCDGHLGHLFDDGPAPTGKRWCMNGVAMKFIPDAK